MQINNTTIDVVRGSVILQKAEAIVNAANEAMQGGGFVDGAIHAAAGPQLAQELKRIAPHGAWTGAALVTKSYGLSKDGIDYIIHAAGPDTRKGKSGNDQLLACCYRSCLEVAEERELKSIAFCSISTGAYEFPLNKAAPLALKTVKDYLKAHVDTSLERIVFAMFQPEEFDAFTEALAQLG